MKLIRAAALMTAATALTTSPASAAQFRLFFVGSEALALQSAAQPTSAAYVGPGPVGAPGDLSASCPTCVPGGTKDAHHGAGVPNQIVTFLHPYTNKAITVPLTLPVGRPTLITKSDRIVYDYGLFSHKVIVKFKPDGQVEVQYKR